MKRNHLILAIFAATLLLPVLAGADSFLPLPSTQELEVVAPQGDDAIEKLANLLGPLARILRILIGTIAVVFIVMSGFVMTIAGDNEDTVGKEKNSLKYGLIGLMMISIAGPVAEVFDFREGNYLTDPEQFLERVQLFNGVTQLIITFIKYFLGSLAALMFIRAGAVMVSQSSNDDELGKAKQSIMVAAAGLFMVMMSDLVIRRVFFVTEYSQEAQATMVAIDQSEFLRQLVGVTNLMVSFVGPIMMLGLIGGAFLYVTAGGDDERTGLAKKIMINSIIGVVIIYGAFALVSTVISGQF